MLNKIIINQEAQGHAPHETLLTEWFITLVDNGTSMKTGTPFRDSCFCRHHYDQLMSSQTTKFILK